MTSFVERLRAVSRIAVACAVTVLAMLLTCAASVEAVVDLAYFRAIDREHDVLVEWATGREDTTFGFNLYRGQSADSSEAIKLNGEPIPAKSFPAMIGADYDYVDPDVQVGVTYYYWLEFRDLGGPVKFGPEWLTLGGTPTPTPTQAPTATPTSTSTPTGTPAATPTPTSTEVPTSTPTLVPSATPTGAPTATPTSLPGTTPSAPPTSAPTGVASPTPSTAPTGGIPAETAPTTSQVTPSATGTGRSVATPTEPGATSSGPVGLGWAGVSIPGILRCVSGASFVGVLLLSIVLVLVRKFGL